MYFTKKLFWIAYKFNKELKIRKIFTSNIGKITNIDEGKML